MEGFFTEALIITVVVIVVYVEHTKVPLTNCLRQMGAEKSRRIRFFECCKLPLCWINDAICRTLLEGRRSHSAPGLKDMEAKCDVAQLCKELRQIKQRLAMYEEIGRHGPQIHTHVIENIGVGDCAVQICISTTGESLHVKGAKAGSGSLQLFGSVSESALMSILEMHYGRHQACYVEEGM